MTSTIRSFKKWLEEGNNTGASMQKNSACTISNQVRFYREKYKNKGLFLELTLKNTKDYEDWFGQELDFIKSISKSHELFVNAKHFIRAFWKFSNSC